jgi:ribonuclease HIII
MQKNKNSNNMNMIKGAVIAILASSTCIVQGQNLRATSKNWNENEEQVTNKDRELQYHGGGV